MGWALLAVLACAGPQQPPDGWLRRLSAAPRPPPGQNWSLPPAKAEALMARAGGEVLRERPTDAGLTGARRLSVYFPAVRRSIDLKWKAAPTGDADGWDNAPRKELAAYAVQKWFLRPEAYVVPSVVCRCIPLDAYRRLDPEAVPTLRGTHCVFGAFALWLRDVEEPEQLYDESRFYRDAAYARGLANFNLLAFLIDDRDTTPSNVLTAEDRSNPLVFSVDNGIAFDPPIYNFFRSNWNEIRVPALPRDSIEQLRRVTPARMRELAVLAQFRGDRKGMLRSVRASAPIEPARGVRFRSGVLQLGLTAEEIDHLRGRLEALLHAIDEGDVLLF